MKKTVKFEYTTEGSIGKGIDEVSINTNALDPGIEETWFESYLLDNDFDLPNITGEQLAEQVISFYNATRRNVETEPARIFVKVVGLDQCL